MCLCAQVDHALLSYRYVMVYSVGTLCTFYTSEMQPGSLLVARALRAMYMI